MPSALDPHGPAAAILAHDGVLVLALFVGVTAVLWLLVLWGYWVDRHRVARERERGR